MFLFLCLLLAHLLGDFPLQFGAVYTRKVKNIKGKILHVAIIALTMVLLASPFWKSPYLWLIILINAVGHYLQDWIKLAIVQKIKNPHNFFLFLGDQILHVASLGLVWFTPLANQIPTSTHVFLNQIYFNPETIKMLVALLIASFAGTFILGTFKSTLLPTRLQTPFLDPLERNYGVLERALMTGLLLLSPYFGLALPLFLFPRFLFANVQIKRFKGNSFEPFMIDTLLGMLLTILIYSLFILLN